MAGIDKRIADIEERLATLRDEQANLPEVEEMSERFARKKEIEEEIRNLLAEQERLEFIREQWLRLGNVCVDDQECIETGIDFEWLDGNHVTFFPVGCHREEIWHWFEEAYDVSVGRDLMGVF